MVLTDEEIRKQEILTSESVNKEPGKIDWQEAYKRLHDGDNHIIALVDYRMDKKHIGRRQIVKVSKETAIAIIDARKGIPVDYLNDLLKEKAYH